MWLPMWVFDGNGFTMACLAVWIRNVALRFEVFRKGEAVRSVGCDGIQWLQSTLSGISVAISGPDFTAYEADFSALIRATEAEGFGRGGRANAYGVFICVMTKAGQAFRFRCSSHGANAGSLLLVCVLPLPSAHETAGATGIRRSPRPLWARDSSTPRALRAARSRTCVWMSLRAKRSNPPFLYGLMDCFASLAMTVYN